MSAPSKNVLISLERRHAENILNGKKKVELRNRRMNLSPGDKIWVYSKLPDGRVLMRATVKSIHVDNPQALWGDFQAKCGISKTEFFTYFDEIEIGYAISLYKIKRLPNPPTLDAIRHKYQTFHPPQFSKYLDGMPLLSFLEEATQ